MDTVVYHVMMLGKVMMPTKCAALLAQNVLMRKHRGWQTMKRHARHHLTLLKRIATRMGGGQATTIASSRALMRAVVMKELSAVFERIG